MSVNVGAVQMKPPGPALLAGREGGALGMGDACSVALAMGRAQEVHLSDIVATALRSQTSGTIVSLLYVCVRVRMYVY